MAGAHDIGVEWTICPQDNCNHRTKYAANMKQHLADVHDIGRPLHACEEPFCDFKTKYKFDLKKHVLAVHDSSRETMHECTEKGCQYKARRRSTLTHHMQTVHGVVPEDKMERYSESIWPKMSGKRMNELLREQADALGGTKQDEGTMGGETWGETVDTMDTRGDPQAGIF